jgi:hypothetical protein
MFRPKIQKNKFDTRKKQRLKTALLNVFVFSFGDNKIKICKSNDKLSLLKTRSSSSTGQYSLTMNSVFFLPTAKSLSSSGLQEVSLLSNTGTCAATRTVCPHFSHNKY